MPEPSPQRPLIAVESDPNIIAHARPGGAAVHTADYGRAECHNYGIAYCPLIGDSNANAAGVAYSRNGGTATTGDGGVSIAKGDRTKATCEAAGVAFVKSPSYAQRGQVKGGPDAVLVISWADAEEQKTYSQTVQVGKTDDCGNEICPNVWYTLDDQHSNKWVCV